MEWQFRSDQPIYTQLTARLTQAIISGEFQPGERLPTVRDLAMEAGVNPNTVQRALAELERDALVYTQRTAGRFVTENVHMIENARFRAADRCVEEFLSEMKKLGCGREEVISLLQNRKEKEE